jgi:hypothetical protein
MNARSQPESMLSVNAGWIAAGLVILVVLGIGAVLWFHYHP